MVRQTRHGEKAVGGKRRTLPPHLITGRGQGRGKWAICRTFSTQGNGLTEEAYQHKAKNIVAGHVIKMDYGMKEKDPIDPVSTLIPKHFQEWLIQVYCKRTDEESLGPATERFERWCNAQNEQAEREDNEGPNST
ncbi:unnamed protein product [Arctogadus glacialis]